MSAAAPVDFTGRVAVVTGAGRGLGREFALLLAARGASVVVNDLGVQSDWDGSGTDPTRAQVVVDEIIAAGGRAVADGHSVTVEDEARKIVARAVEEFGRIDIVVNNAGLLGPERSVVETPLVEFQRLLDVHVLGTLFVTQAAWPHLERQRYGRIVNIVSGGMFGHGTELAYSTAKAGQYGLTRALADAGRSVGIRANAMMPYAWTPMAAHAMSQNSPISGDGKSWMGEWLRDVARPEVVAPLVCWLAHEDCPANAELFSAGAGRVARAALVDTPGYIDPELTLESVREHFDEIRSDDRWEIHFTAPARAKYHFDLVEAYRAGAAAPPAGPVDARSAVEAYFGALDRGDLEGAAAVFAEDCVYIRAVMPAGGNISYGTFEPILGRAGVLEFLTEQRGRRPLAHQVRTIESTGTSCWIEGTVGGGHDPTALFLAHACVNGAGEISRYVGHASPISDPALRAAY